MDYRGVTDLVIRILNEADIAGRPGQYDRLNQISKDVERTIQERMAQAWDEGALKRAQYDPACSVRNLNPYRSAS